MAADPHDESNVANAICTSFLELIDEKREGKLLEPHLGEECKRFLNLMRCVDLAANDKGCIRSALEKASRGRA